MMKRITASDIPRNPNPLTGRDKILALSFAILVAALGSMLIVEGVAGTDHDDGIYIITGKALAQAEGYRLIHLPHAPPQTKYPFLYPALLAIIWKLFPAFPENLLLMQWLTLLTGAATAAFSYLYLVRFAYCSRFIAGAIILLWVTSPRYLFLCSNCMSEMPFTLSLILAMWALSRHLESPLVSRTAQLCLGILLTLPMLFRTIGFVVLFVTAYYVWKRKSIMRWPATGAAIIVLPYILWLLRFSLWSSPASNDSYYTNYISWWHAYGTPLLSRILTSNAIDICQSFYNTHLSRWPFLPFWACWLIVPIGILGLGNIARQITDNRVMPKVLIPYLAIVLFWPWPPVRFLIPILPFLYCYLIMAIIGIFKSTSRILKPVGLAMLAVPLIANADAVHDDMAIGKANRYPGHMLLSMHSSSVAWSSYQDMFDWIKRNSQPSDLFISGIDPMLYLYTGRRGIRPFASRPSSMYYEDPEPALGPLSEIMANLKFYNAQYLILSPMPGLPEEIPYAQFVVESQRTYPGWLERVYVGKDQRFVIWRIVGAGT